MKNDTTSLRRIRDDNGRAVCPPRSAKTSDFQLRSAATGAAVPIARMSRATRKPKRKELEVQRDREAHERSRTCDDRHAGDAREARVERESNIMKFNFPHCDVASQSPGRTTEIECHSGIDQQSDYEDGGVRERRGGARKPRRSEVRCRI